MPILKEEVLTPASKDTSRTKVIWSQVAAMLFTLNANATPPMTDTPSESKIEKHIAMEDMNTDQNESNTIAYKDVVLPFADDLSNDIEPDDSLTEKITTYPNGNKKSITHYNAAWQKHGLHETYYENGQLNVIWGYKNWLQEWLWVYYYENGAKHSQLNYKDWYEDWLCEYYNSNGELSERWNFKNWERQWIWEEIKNGKVVLRSVYENGVRIE